MRAKAAGGADAGRFAGYPRGAAVTGVPNVFFTELLPRLAARPVDLAVATYAFFAIGRKRGSPRYATRSELLAEEPLRQGVAGAMHSGTWDAGSVARELAAALDALQRDGLLLAVDIDGGRERAYFLPSPADRRAMERVRALGFPRGDRMEGRRAASPAERDPARSTDIVAWYEGTIGAVPPVLVDELREAEALYPDGWVAEAFLEAARLNHRSWKYVRTILERWAEEGRDDDAQAERDTVATLRDRYYGGRWRKLLD